MLPGTYRIPLDTSEKILVAFGITKATRQYDRWVKDDGFDIKDFGSVLFESSFTFTIDWRAVLQDELQMIVEALRQLDVTLASEWSDDGCTGFVECGKRRAPVKYRPSDGDDFDAVIRTLQSIIPEGIEFRASPDNADCDTWAYAVLPRERWRELEQLSPDVIARFFQALPTATDATVPPPAGRPSVWSIFRRWTRP